MTADALQRSVAFFRAQVESWPVPDLVPRLARLLSAGEPVSVERVATAGGWTSRRMAGSPASGSPCTPPRTASPSTARPCTGSAPALEFPVLLDRPGRIESTCPVTGRPSCVEVTPSEVLTVDPPEAVVSTVRPTQAVTDIRVYGDLGNFFSSPGAATDWLARNPRRPGHHRR